MREDIGAEGGIVLGGIAERLDRSGDSPFPFSPSFKSHLPLFVSLCTSSSPSAIKRNTLLTPDACRQFRPWGNLGDMGGFHDLQV